jgi:hypothetical protein
VVTGIRISAPQSTLPVRPLHRTERELLACFAPAVDLERVRVVTRHSRLGRLVTRLSGGAAVTLGYRIFLPSDPNLPLMAHELTHVSQYQRWGWWRYYISGIWNQFILRRLCRRDVYRWQAAPGKTFEQFGMEQQGQIVEDCFNLHSPRRGDARTISPFMPR